MFTEDGIRRIQEANQKAFHKRFQRTQKAFHELPVGHKYSFMENHGA